MLPSKQENLSRCSKKLIHFCKKNYHLHWIADRANILGKYIIYIFLNFRCGFCGSFSLLFPKSPASCGKKILKYFCWITLLFVWDQKVCLSFLKSYFTLEILIFLSFVVSFLVDMFNGKAPFLMKKSCCSREAIEN